MIDINKTTQRLTGIITILGIAIFFIFLFMPIIGMRFALNKAPVSPKSWEDIKDYPKKYENYFNDRFGFRTTLLQLNNYIHVAFLSTSPISKVLVGKDNWLFFIPEALNNYRRLKAKSSVREWRDILNKRQILLEKNGIEFLFVFAPDKHSIYPELIPDRITQIKDRSFMDELIDELRQSTNVKILDLRPVLIEGKKLEQLYDKTGTHWNQYGAYIASSEILNHLSLKFPEIQSVLPLNSPFDYLAKKERPGADLAMMMGLQFFPQFAELPTVIHDHEVNFIQLKKHITSFNKARKNFKTVSKNKKLPKCVIFRDSFGAMLAPYLSEGFGELTYLWQDNFDIEFLLKQKPDIVIEEIAERKLTLSAVRICDVKRLKAKHKKGKALKKQK